MVIVLIVIGRRIRQRHDEIARTDAHICQAVGEKHLLIQAAGKSKLFFCFFPGIGSIPQMGSQPFLQTGKSLLFLLCPCIQNPHITHTGQKHFIHVRDVFHPFPAHWENIIAHAFQDEIRAKAVSPFRSGDKIAVHVRFFMCRAVDEGAIGKNHVHVVGIILFCSFYDPVDDFFVPVRRRAVGLQRQLGNLFHLQRPFGQKFRIFIHRASLPQHGNFRYFNRYFLYFTVTAERKQVFSYICPLEKPSSFSRRPH